MVLHHLVKHQPLPVKVLLSIGSIVLINLFFKYSRHYKTSIIMQGRFLIKPWWELYCIIDNTWYIDQSSQYWWYWVNLLWCCVIWSNVNHYQSKLCSILSVLSWQIYFSSIVDTTKPVSSWQGRFMIKPWWELYCITDNTWYIDQSSRYWWYWVNLLWCCVTWSNISRYQSKFC
jgi:hypothetical protein